MIDHLSLNIEFTKTNRKMCMMPNQKGCIKTWYNFIVCVFWCTRNLMHFERVETWFDNCGICLNILPSMSSSADIFLRNLEYLWNNHIYPVLRIWFFSLKLKTNTLSVIQRSCDSVWIKRLLHCPTRVNNMFVTVCFVLCYHQEIKM